MRIGQYIIGAALRFLEGGQGGLFTVEVFDKPNAPTHRGDTVEQKSDEDTAWRALQQSASARHVTTLAATGCKEMPRLRFSIAARASPHVFDTVYINVPAPVWRPW